MTKETETKDTGPTPAQLQAVEKLQKDFFNKNKITLSLTLDQYHAIINLMAQAKMSEGFYVMQDTLKMGDPQKETLTSQYNKMLSEFKTNGFKSGKSSIKAVKTVARKTA